MTIFKHEMKMNLKSLLIWALTVGGMNFVFMMIFPSLKDQMAGMEALYSDMGSFTAAFGMDKISVGTALGFYGIEAGAMLSLGGAMFGAMIGTSMLCKEEGNHTAEFLYTTPASRASYIIWKGIATIFLVFLFDIICFICGYGSFLAMGETIDMKLLLLYHVAQVSMHIQIALICFGISAFLKRNNIGMGLGIAILLYFVQMFVNISDKAEFLKYVTPYCYSDAAEIFSTGEINLLLWGIGMGIMIVFCGTGFIKYSKKDLAA